MARIFRLFLASGLLVLAFATTPAHAEPVQLSAPLAADVNGGGQIPEYLHAILTHPAMQRFLLFTADPEVQKAAMTIAQNPSRGDLIYWQLSWFLLIFVMKFWLARRSGKPWVKIVNLVWSSALYLCGAVVAIPTFVLGDSYLQFLKGMLRMFGIG